ncbi:TfuA-like protein [Oryzifoliimicrobium ureilyticus]|uniref:TfuA-like protein n=1 Tax=Oryzifoliimicrobium ureilyticus TaxID=3113724 RepID=UPI003076276E
MKIIFVGPTVTDATDLVSDTIEIRGPAMHRDILDATNEGATVIGIVDGCFEDAAPVRHKEILFALAKGVRVYGAGSMGALRAAECQVYGMIGIGKIFTSYANGQLIDDSDVAQIHGPTELNYLPLSEPLVNVIATLDHLLSRQKLDRQEYEILRASAERLFFKDRTYRSVVARADLSDGSSRNRLEDLLLSNAVDQKRRDALELIAAVEAAEDIRHSAEKDWSFISTAQWRRSL